MGPHIMIPFWIDVGRELGRTLKDNRHLDEGQQRSVRFILEKLPKHGVVLADEVGTGKTRIACALIDAVMRCGGRAVAVVPRGLLGQWRDEFTQFREAKAEPRILTTWLDFLQDSSANRTPGEWWLVSHGFRFPALQATSPAWKFALPWLVLLAAEKEQRSDGRTRLSRLWDQVKEDSCRWSGQWEIAQEMAKRLPGHLREALNELPLPNWEGGDNTDLTELFSRSGERGRALRIVDELLRRWVGRVDLVIVDEAHKSRDFDESAPRTVLSELLEYSLLTDGDTRRLCMTATPMELSTEQWSPLLHRARAEADKGKLEAALVGFKDAVGSASGAPDEEPRIAALEKAGTLFQTTLRPYVTRRRRRAEALLLSFRAAVSNSDVPQPHRNLARVPVRWDTDVKEAGRSWGRILIALEGIARTARGISHEQLPWLAKTLHTKLATGHISLDLFGEETLSAIFDDEPNPQQKRFRFWCKEFAQARKEQRGDAAGLGQGFDPDTEHPRILAAVREIESWVAGEGGRSAEKVLCFGVFLHPLRLLRDVLNVRHALRCVDRDEPVPATVEMLGAVTFRNYQRMLAEQRFAGRLQMGGLSQRALMGALKRGHKAYTSGRKRIAGRVNRQLAELLAGWGIELEHEPLRRLREALHTIALESNGAGRPETEWCEVVTAVIEGREEGRAGSPDTDSDSTTRLLAWIDGEHGSDADGRVRSGFCRLLQGASEWETRRTVQASFNKVGTFPMVLLAQSQVGREGLNLHRACRVVVQFHAEWNPAILEQQIGRVDRKCSLWERRATSWLATGAGSPPPLIEVRQIVFDGTYDAKQWERVGRRQHLFDAALFGSLLPLEAWLRATNAQRRRLEAAAPDFSPP